MPERPWCRLPCRRNNPCAQSTVREGAEEELNVDVVGVEVDKSSHFLLALRLLWEGAFKTVSFLTVFLRLALGNDIIVMLKKVPE